MTEYKVNASDNVQNKPECTKAEEDVPVASHRCSLLQSVVKTSYKTGVSKDDDCSL